MIGIGGGIVFVPFFLLVFKFSPQEAIGTSLFVVFFNALSGSISYLQQRRVDIGIGWRFAVATLPGAVLGAWLARYFTDTSIGLIFGIFMAVIAIFIFRRGESPLNPIGKQDKGRNLTDTNGKIFNYHLRERLGIVISFVVGMISSLLGIGGGIIHVPTLVFILSFPIHIATATSHFVLVISTFFGSVAHISFGNVQIVPGLIVAAFAILGAQIGARVSRRVKGHLIARLLAAILVLAGVRLVLESLDVF
jgi:uncharacterized membrane protein YfcA